jgi:hypothetical protein
MKLSEKIAIGFLTGIVGTALALAFKRPEIGLKALLFTEKVLREETISSDAKYRIVDEIPRHV